MIDEHDDMLDELRAAMNIDPSPAFEARVRRAVAAGARRPAWLPWTWAAGVAAAAIALGVIATLRRVPAEDARPNAPAIAAAPSPAPAPTAPMTTAGVDAPRRPTGTIARNTRGPDLRVIVPKGEARAFAQLVAAARRGDLAHVQLFAPVATAPLETPAAIDIAPIEIPPVTAEED